jgi:hypothetical protein
MPPEMADEIDEERKKYDMSFAEYVRRVLREHEGTPFSCNDPQIGVDGNGDAVREEGAA